MNCPSCGLFNPSDALVCDCGYDFETGRAPDIAARGGAPAVAQGFDGFLMRHPGKILLAGILVPMPLRGAGSVSGELGYFLIGEGIFLACIGLAIAGWLMRKKRT